ncbi:glucoamylase family protein, partial [Mesorhizobium sp. M1D.F.Ca.ET.234.01.1.1]
CKGFYYHFLDIRTGRRVWKCELSTVDTALLLAGALAAGAYFDGDDESELEIRRLADALYRRVDWRWAQNGGATVTHGWRPEKGFLRYRWEGYDEALILYVLGLGSPTHPLPPE